MTYACEGCGQTFEQPGYCRADGQPLHPVDDPLIGSELGRYRLARVLGRGGMGRVYLGVHVAAGGRVAIKVLSEDCAVHPQLVERFLVEARAVNLVKHGSIASVLDLQHMSDGRPYIVMEYVEGPTLRQVSAGGVAPLGGVAQVIGEVLHALAAAHAAGVIHRDLKPDNVLVTTEGHAKVLDFGIAKLSATHGPLPRTHTGVILGTPEYMAPEQISEGVASARSDLYAVGVMMYEAICGCRPFDGASDFEVMRAHVDEPVPSPRLARADLTPALEAVILRALEKRPADRYASATEMAEALARAAALLPVDQQRELSARARPLPPPAPPPAPAPETRDARSSGPEWRVPADAGIPGLDATIRERPSARRLEARPVRPQARAASRSDSAAADLRRPRPRRLLILVGTTGVLAAVAVTVAVVAASGGGSPKAAASTPPAPPALSPAPPGPPAVPAVAPGELPRMPAFVPATLTMRAAIGLPLTIARTGTGTGATASSVDFDPKAFEPMAYLPRAEARARAVAPDAELVGIVFEGVRDDGTISFADGDLHGYVFRSLARSRPSRAAEQGVLDYRACLVTVQITPEGVVSQAVEDVLCNWPLVRHPGCTARALWDAARADGVLEKRTASLVWGPERRWLFELAPGGQAATAPRWFVDDCR